MTANQSSAVFLEEGNRSTLVRLVSFLGNCLMFRYCMATGKKKIPPVPWSGTSSVAPGYLEEGPLFDRRKSLSSSVCTSTCGLIGRLLTQLGLGHRVLGESDPVVLAPLADLTIFSRLSIGRAPTWAWRQPIERQDIHAAPRRLYNTPPGLRTAPRPARVRPPPTVVGTRGHLHCLCIRHGRLQ